MIAEVTGLDKRFGHHQALRGVDLTIAPGEIVALIGANGAGKSTLIRCLLGLIAADRGVVRVLGSRPSPAGRRRTGYVPQGMGLWPDLTVGEHLELLADGYDHAPTEPDDPDVAGVLGHLIRDLPLGLRRRVAFTLALAHRPELLVLDEPTAGVDALGRRHAWDTIRDEAARGAGVLVSTHYLDEAALAHRVILLAAGRVVAAGTVPALLDGHTATEVVGGRWKEAWDVLAAAHLPVLPAGRRLRIPDTGERVVQGLLADAGLRADVATVPATLEELFLMETSR